MARRLTSLLAALLLATVAHGQVLLNKFGPVTGVLVGTAGNPATVAAAITDLQPILSTTPGLVLNGAAGGTKGAGTINATGLYVNGSAVGVGGGAVSSVSISVPTPTGGCWGTSGNPVTSSGTLGVTLSGNTSQLIRADGSCSNIITAPASGPTLTENVVAGTTYGHVLSGSASNNIYYEATNGTQIFAAGISSSNGIFAGSISGTEFDLGAGGNMVLKLATTGDVTIPTPTSGNTLTVDVLDNAGVTFSGPNSSRGFQLNFFDSTASVYRGFIGIGISTVTGAAVTDFALSPGAGGSVVIGTANGGGIATRFGPSGNVTINAPSSGTALTVTGASGAQALVVNAGLNQNAGEFIGSATTGGSFGPVVLAGTNASDQSLVIQNHAGTAIYLEVRGDGETLIGPTASSLIVNTAGNVSISAPSSGAALALNGAANASTFQINGSSTTGQSYGETIVAGTNATDYSWYVQGIAGAAYATIHGDGGMTIGNPTGGDKGGGSVNAGSLYINGVAVTSGGFPHASCYVTVSGTTPTLVNRFGCSAVTRGGTGQYTVSFGGSGFTDRPVCTTVSYGNAVSGYVNDPSSSSSMVFQFFNTTTNVNTDPAGFMVNCTGT